MENQTNADKLLTKKQAECAKAIDYLKSDYLKAGDTVYTILRHVSKSGMSRCIDFYVVRENNPLRITWTVATALDDTYDRKMEALRVSGCGMDMGYSVVSRLARILFGDGYALQHRWL